MPYFDQEYCDKFVGKTIEKMESPSKGELVVTFTDKSTMTIQAWVEHEKITRDVNLVVNTKKESISCPEAHGE